MITRPYIFNVCKRLLNYALTLLFLLSILHSQIVNFLGSCKISLKHVKFNSMLSGLISMSFANKVRCVYESGFQIQIFFRYSRDSEISLNKMEIITFNKILYCFYILFWNLSCLRENCRTFWMIQYILLYTIKL